MKFKKICVILLTWKRIERLEDTLTGLSNQTFKDFDLYISNGNLDFSSTIDQITDKFQNKLQIYAFHDGNDQLNFRRMFVARNAAKNGARIILFIDDDIDFTNEYIETMIKQYKPYSYGSGFAWSFNLPNLNYLNRVQRYDNKKRIHYCGTGISVIDSRIFLEDGLFEIPDFAKRADDIWLSYYADHVMGWDLFYTKVPEKTIINGADEFAAYKTMSESEYDKNYFLQHLVDLGWKL